MNHSEAKLILPWYLNGSLDEDERRLIERHLESCQECRKELKEWDVAQAAVQDQEFEEDGPSEELLAGAMAHIRSQSAKGGRLGSLQRWALPLAAGLLLAVVSYQNAVQIPQLQSIARAATVINDEQILKGGERDGESPKLTVQEYSIIPFKVMVFGKMPADRERLRGVLRGEDGRRLVTDDVRCTTDFLGLRMVFTGRWNPGEYQLTVEERRVDGWQALEHLTREFDIQIATPVQE